jgi:hypothetical protein
MILKANISEREQQVIGVLFETRKLGAEFSLLVKIEGRDLYAKEVLGAASLHEGVA